MRCHLLMIFRSMFRCHHNKLLGASNSFLIQHAKWQTGQLLMVLRKKAKKQTKVRKSKYPEVEKCLIKWFTQERKKNSIVGTNIHVLPRYLSLHYFHKTFYFENFQIEQVYIENIFISKIFELNRFFENLVNSKIWLIRSKPGPLSFELNRFHCNKFL